MNERQRQTRSLPTTPAGMEPLAQEVATTEWLSSSLTRIRKLASSKRRDQVANVLVKWLEQSSELSPSEYHDSLEQASLELCKRESKIDELTLEVEDLRVQHETLLSQVESRPSLVDEFGNRKLGFVLIRRWVWNFALVVGVISLFINAILLWIILGAT